MMVRSTYTFVAYYASLTLFAIGGLLLSALALLAGVLPPSERTERVFRRIIHHQCKALMSWMEFAGLLHVRYHGFGELDRTGRGRIIVANHPALTDITSLLARVPEALCIFKPAIRRNPVFGAAARRAGYLASDGGHEVIRQATAKLAAGQTVIIFPEGTRTPPGVAVLPFKAGFVVMARRAAAPIQLIRIAYSRPVLARGWSWWKTPPFPARVDLTIGPCVQVTAVANTALIAAEIEAWFRSPVEAAACCPWSPALAPSTP